MKATFKKMYQLGEGLLPSPLKKKLAEYEYKLALR